MSASVKSITLPGPFAANPVLTKGDGPPVVFLHGAFGQEWNPLLDDLSKSYTVYAPAHPGSIDAGDLTTLHSFWELVLYYDDLFTALGLEQFDLIGHSFGGMAAAEYAATYPGRVRRLILIDAMGLWSYDHPVEDHLLASEETRRALLYHDQANPGVVERLAVSSDPEKALDAFIAQYQALAGSAHFIHPIPERGLDHRLRRIAAKTLVVWGTEDRLTPIHYADAFQAGIPDAKVVRIADAGHVPFVEQRGQVSPAVEAFLT
ncbi:alpha/beta fold hydrolase [Brevundimonas diminuta]|uniref:alpha/beta fold hydrolase n=1 Tax=Brevundimonas diminuta TaxID=293 RepID=UPI003D9AB256